MDPFTAIGLGIALAFGIRGAIVGMPESGDIHHTPPSMPGDPSSNTDPESMEEFAVDEPAHPDGNTTSEPHCPITYSHSVVRPTRHLSEDEYDEAASAIRRARRKS